ncbi:zinc finger protein 83-like [Maniola hyperantus]|uniref:zinc finger protein 83-like n=1 Tax=Aphantopus hyperantus TaxID=2795564 RepID=UPI0015688A04|nr:zinc finger protein 660-like [Maniola hyperantus]
MAPDVKFAPYRKCCRTCLKEDSLMFDLFVERIESSGTNIADMLTSCSKLNIQKDDSLPNQICRYCFKSVLAFSHFSLMAQKAEDKLKEAMLINNEINENQSSEGDVIEIKIENVDHENILFESREENFENDNISLDENKNSEQCNEQVKPENPKLSCAYCKKHFSKLSKLKQHEEKHLNKETCMDTKHNKNGLALTMNDENLELNVKNESNDIDLTCNICSSRLESMNLLSTHMKIHEEKDGMYSCKECNKVFKKRSHLKRHKTIHKDQFPHVDLLNIITPKENVDTNILCEPKDQFKCSKCLLAFKSINSLSAHMRKHTEKGRIISCKECNKIFKKLSHLKRHEIQHGINCPYKCNVCPKAFPTKDALEEHVNKHRGVKPHGCPVCHKRFSHLSTLTTHIKLHTREKVYLCPNCGKKMNSSTNLNQHMLRHTGLKEFACTFCPKRFVSKGELKSHTITHTGERSCTCDQCGATFTKRSSLTKHKERHLGLKPHQCETCLMRFTCKDHLKRHYRIHTGEKPYRCDMCERAFTQSNDLVKHRRSHLGDKVYKCPQCTESFRLNAELRQHISEHFINSQLLTTNVSKDPSTDGAGNKDYLKPSYTVIGTNNDDIITKISNSVEM